MASLAKPGLRIMLLQFGSGLLFGIAIALLQEAYGSLTGANHPRKLSVAVFVPPVKKTLTETRPLGFE